jgi:hypothetical protein
MMLVIAPLLSGCGGSSSNFSCPSSSDDITWTSYGHFQMQKSGGDATARNCISKCGWQIFNGNNGGIGNTLQVASPDDSVVLAWAYSEFAAMRVTKGWTGQTAEGVKLGDSMATFLSHYPTAATVSPTHLKFSTSNANIDAYFDQNSNLTELLVNGYITP